MYSPHTAEFKFCMPAHKPDQKSWRSKHLPPNRKGRKIYRVLQAPSVCARMCLCFVYTEGHQGRLLMVDPRNVAASLMGFSQLSLLTCYNSKLTRMPTHIQPHTCWDVDQPPPPPPAPVCGEMWRHSYYIEAKMLSWPADAASVSHDFYKNWMQRYRFLAEADVLKASAVLSFRRKVQRLRIIFLFPPWCHLFCEARQSLLLQRDLSLLIGTSFIPHIKMYK